MDAGFWGFVGVVVGSVITAIVTMGGEVLRGRNDFMLDSKKRQDDRRIESDRLQRETLLELQDRLADWMQDRPRWLDARWTGEIDKEMDEFAQRSLLAGRSLSRLTQRLLDDELHESLTTLQDLSGQAVLATTEAELEETWRKTVFGELRAQAHLGRVLRTYLQPRELR